MKVLLTKASERYEDVQSTKIIEIDNIFELKKFYPQIIIDFEKPNYLIEEFGDYDFKATIYDDYVEDF